MAQEKISLQELREEICAMLAVCFEGEIGVEDGCLMLKLLNGQRFLLKLTEPLAVA